MATGNGQTRPQRPPSAAQQVRDFASNQASRPIGPSPGKPAKVKNGGGFNPSFNPSVAVNVMKNGGAPTAATAGQNGTSTGTPGGDFMSNEDIRAFSEHARKAARKRAVERALDAEMLEARLRNIPDQYGNMSGSRARARRVSRHLKRIAQAEKLIAKYAAALYAAFEREYEAELMKIGKARTQQKRPQKFGWF